MQPNAIPSPYSLFCFCPGNINQTYLRKEGLGTYGNDLVDTTFKNYLNSSSSCSLDTQRWPREEAMGGNRCLEIEGRVRVCHREIHKLLGYNIRQMIICYQQTMQCKAFSIKTLSFVDLYSEGAEPKRKMFAETETRVISIPPSSEWMLDRLIFSPGCLNSSDLKVSLTSFTGGKKSCKMSY